MASPFDSLRGQPALCLIHPIFSTYPDVLRVDNRPVLEAEHSTPSTVQFKNGWNCIFRRQFYGVHRGEFQLQNFSFIRFVKTIVFHVITHLSVTEFGVQKICSLPTFLNAHTQKCVAGNLPVAQGH